MDEKLFTPQAIDTYRTEVQPALSSKVGELHHHGYTRATEDEIWKCLKKKRWKKRETLRLHELVSDVLTLSIHEYMSYLTQENYKEQDWFADFEKDE